MPTPLSKADQEEILHSKIGLSLDNFRLAWRIADLLIEYAEAALPPPRAMIRLLAQDLGDQAQELPGFGTGVGIEEFLGLIHRQHQRRCG